MTDHLLGNPADQPPEEGNQTMKRNTVDLDGTVYAYDIDHDLKLASVTIAGYSDEHPTVVMFDKDDLDTLNDARKELKRGPAEPDPGTVLSILNAAGLTNQFIYDRVEYRLLEGKWVAYQRVDIEDDVCDCDDCDNPFCPRYHAEGTR